MRCPRCRSENVRVEMLTEQKFERKKKSFLYWITIGWFIEPLLWLFLTFPKLFYELFKPGRYKGTTTTKKYAVCQNCGHSWKK